MHPDENLCSRFYRIARHPTCYSAKRPYTLKLEFGHPTIIFGTQIRSSDLFGQQIGYHNFYRYMLAERLAACQNVIPVSVNLVSGIAPKFTAWSVCKLSVWQRAKMCCRWLYEIDYLAYCQINTACKPVDKLILHS